MSRIAVVTGRPAIDQDVLDAPPHMIAEIINGALRLQPRPAAGGPPCARGIGPGRQDRRTFRL